jgi:hypothetical protein
MPKMVKMQVATLFVFHAITCFSQGYPGRPWNSHAQELPGRIQCEWYDQGGEGVAYHDTDSINNGSGKLNPVDGTFLNEFRMGEGVDISYTKPAPVDVHPYNKVEPVMKELYVGWTVAGEWINYTVKVTKTGAYTVALMYSASGDGEISLSVDGNDLTGRLSIPSTRAEEETVEWRQWHHWNRVKSLATVALKKGVHLLTLKTVSYGNMNFDYVEFQLKK